MKDDFAVGINELGSQGKGINVGDRSHILPAGNVSDPVIILHTGCQGPQKELGLIHFSVVKTQSMVGLIDTAVEDLDLRMLHCKTECVWPERVVSRKDHPAVLRQNSVKSLSDFFLVTAIVKAYSFHDTPEGFFEVIHAQHMAIDPS